MWAVDGGKPSAGAKTFVKLKPRIRQIRAFALPEGKAADRAQRARGRLPRSTAAGDDTLRNRIEPMHGQRRTLQKRLERQPASAVTTSPSAGWTCASARPRTAVATLPSCRSLRRALQPRRVRVRLPSLLAWLRTAPQSTPSSISTSTSTRATFSKSSTRPAAPARL